MKYIVYLTKNKKSKVNGLERIYIGVHQTKDPNIFDGYIGCGVYINCPSSYMYPKTPFQYAVKKYGVEAFERVVLYIFDSAEEAYQRESEIVDISFIKQSHVYNASIGGIGGHNYGCLYQFDLKGTLIKKWDYSKEVYDFYGVTNDYFAYAVHDKHPLFGSLWSTENSIDPTEYVTQKWGEPKLTHLYNKDGKWLREFMSRKECAAFLNTTEAHISKAVLQNNLISEQYYVSNTRVDLFQPKARAQYYRVPIYIYNDKSEFLGCTIGKKIFPVIGNCSWHTINDAFRYSQGWYKNFYLSLVPVKEAPKRNFLNKVRVDVLDKWGNFIETLDTIKQLRLKYNVPSAKIKNIQMGDRYFGDYIFRYHRELSK